jgi:hypothetical protein
VVGLTDGRNQRKNPNDFWSEWQDSNLRPLRPERPSPATKHCIFSTFRRLPITPFAFRSRYSSGGFRGAACGSATPPKLGQVLRRFEADVFPAIGRRPIAELEPPELLDMLRKVEKRGVNETARRLKQLIGQVFRFAIVTGRAKRDPSADLKDALRASGEPQRHRAMPLQELPADVALFIGHQERPIWAGSERFLPSCF